jgi:type IV pilus assembly protein PilX
MQQRGIVLVSSLLLLLVVTIMALSIFRSFGMQEKIAGNTREKQRALQSAVGADNYAEWWIANSSNAPLAVAAGIASTASTTCSAVIDGNLNPTKIQICSNTMASLGMSPATMSPGTVPWNAAGTTYAPANLMNIAGAAVVNTGVTDAYYQKPEFYVTDLGPVATGSGELYKVDAASYGLTPSTVAVVESTLAVTCATCSKQGL